MRKLREKRKRMNLTQEDVAERADIPRTTVSKVETGYQNVSLQKLMQIADAMDMRLEINLVPMNSKRAKK
ncbi:helix-turn-helix domain-containing protein [Candidatus Dojkabacteria bacterium]|nr:helix-turn-helix domain-containing protein [Candidatus Dojkabacteria bacterium]